MSKLIYLKKWLSIDRAAQRLSTSLNEPVTERDIYQLCAENQLKISLFFPESTAGYTKGRPFCPCLIGDFVKEFISCFKLVYKRKYGSVAVESNDFDLNFMDDKEYEQLENQTFSAFYDWYSPDTQTALYMEEHILKGLHEIIPDKNPRFFQWLNELALNNINSIYQGKCHTGVLTFFATDDYVDVTFFQREWRSDLSAPTREEALDKANIQRFIEDNYSQRKHQRQNPKLSELPNLLVIQTKHLIEFEQNLLAEQQMNDPDDAGTDENNKSLYIDNLFTNTPSQRKPELLKLCMKLAERHIKHEGSYPDALELWNMLIEEYADDYDQEQRTIAGLSSINGLSDKAFRKKFDEWTKITEIKTD